jgi:putative ABC transport system permease protein
MKIPLSWLQLTHEKVRLLIALAGISFADLLMFMQLGFQAALFESSVTIHRNFEGDIFLMSPQSDSIAATKQFSQRRLYESLAVDGVTAVNPVYLGLAVWKNHVTRATRSILVLGFNPEDRVFKLPDVKKSLAQLKLEDTVLFDEKSRPEYGPIATEFRSKKKVETEASSRRIKVGGLFAIGASFASDGNVITSDLNFIRIFSERKKGLVDIGIIHLKADANPEIVLQQLKEKLPKDVIVLSREEFIDREIKYWQNSTAIGFIFTLGTAMGFVVGIVIVYQILYTDVNDHLPEYATLKAMGYKDKYFIIVVFQEAILLALIGYIPGVAVASFLYSLTAGATNLPIAMSLSRALTVLILTIIMCCVSGVIAVKKLSAADPADIF